MASSKKFNIHLCYSSWAFPVSCDHFPMSYSHFNFDQNASRGTLRKIIDRKLYISPGMGLLWLLSGVCQSWCRNSYFWPFYGYFYVEIDPKWTLSLNHGAFFFGGVHTWFEPRNGFTKNTFRGVPSLGPEFAFLVAEIGLRNPKFIGVL